MIGDVAPTKKDVTLSTRSLLPLVALLVLLFAPQALAAEDAQLARIATMPVKELEAFVGAVTATVGQDSLRMRNAGETGECLELTRTANSFALGYRYLAAARDAMTGKPGNDRAALRDRILQSRVLTFAALVRADEWLKQRCRGFVVPAEMAADPRYQPPVAVATADFTEAVIETREAAEANLAVAVAAGISGKCSAAISAAQGIQLFIPYVDKLLNDVSDRPQALGPRASRRGLQTTRGQLVAALAKLDSAFSGRCGGQTQAPASPQTPAAPQP